MLNFADLGLNRFTLSFPPDIEPEFLDHYFVKSLKQLRFYLLLAVVFFASFGILDVAIAPDQLATLWLIRFGWICPVLGLCILCSFSGYFRRCMQPTLMATMVCTGFGIIHMVASCPFPVSHYYYAGLMLVFIYCYTFLRIRFVWATIAGWVIVIVYQFTAADISRLPQTVLINNSFFLISANIIGMLACYSIEYYARRDFYMARLLGLEQEKVRAVNQDLERRVQERTAQLVATNESLQQEMHERERAEQHLIQVQKMDAIGTLAGGIAHDFNNILTGIMGYAEVGLYKKDLSEEKIRYSFRQILQAGERARNLIKQILTFSRQQEPEKIPVRVGGIVQEALSLLSATISRSIQIQCRVTAAADLVLADPTQIHQVIMNLCTNAAHAMKDCGGTIEVVLENIERDSPGGHVLTDSGADLLLALHVRDTGTGMDPAIRERIFDPFFSTKAKGEGTGMGLSVTHGIVRGCGGAITVDTAPGTGSCFHVYLPVAVRPVLGTGDTAAPLPTGTERILFIDDEEALADVGKEMLEEFGYRVTSTTDPRHALELFRLQPDAFDLVITDKSMPNMSGFDLAKNLIQIRPGMPVVLCSGYCDKSDIEHARSIGLRELIVKPLVMREVAQTIRSVLEQKN